MAKLFDRLFKKKQAVTPAAPKAGKSAYAPLPRPTYDFVEQYTIVDPKRVLNSGYELFSWCPTVPVVCEESRVSPTGFRAGIQLPTNIVMGFLQALEKAPARKIANPKMRTLSIIHLNEKCCICIFPDLKSPKQPILWVKNDDNQEGIGWSLYVTPEKNRAIVEQLKKYTR